MGRAEDLFDRLVDGGETALDEMIAEQQTEDLFLDYKQSADAGANAKLHPRDLENLGKAISGFGNSEGGVIVWGVECKPDNTGADVPSRKVPLANPKAFVGWLEHAVSGCTLPVHSRVRHVPIASSRAATGFVVTLIPQSDHAPHQRVSDCKYYMRAGSSFMPVTHGILAGMFGRAPRPHVTPEYRAQRFHLKNGAAVMHLSLSVANMGRGFARDVFVNLNVAPSQDQSKIELGAPNPSVWSAVPSYAGTDVRITNDGIRVPPGVSLPVAELRWTMYPPFSSELSIHGVVGANGSASVALRLSPSLEVLRAEHERLSGNGENYMGEASSSWIQKVFGIDF